MKHIFLWTVLTLGLLGCSPQEAQDASREAPSVSGFQQTATIPIRHRPGSLQYVYLPLEPEVFDDNLARKVQLDFENATIGTCDSREAWLKYLECTQQAKSSTARVGEYIMLFQLERKGGTQTDMRLLSVKAGRALNSRNTANFNDVKLYFLVGIQQNTAEPWQSFVYRLKHQGKAFEFKVQIDPA